MLMYVLLTYQSAKNILYLSISKIIAMKKLYKILASTFVFSLSFSSLIFGQMTVDSIIMGPSYANDIYYSMQNGEVHSVDRTNWDIAFHTHIWSSEILVNDGKGAELRTYPYSDTTGWNAIDTTGLSNWPVLYNDANNWLNGAFSRSSKGHPDYGWGRYNTITHEVIGDSLYILTFADGTAKKLWIVKKKSTQNTYIFKYADLDGSNEVNSMVNCGDYQGKNFVYFSLQTGEILDREPAADSWDILFTKYVAILENDSPYPVTGVLNNINVPANEYNEVGPDFDDWTSLPMDSTRSPIGYDWKTFDMGSFSYIVDDSTAFFLSNMNADVYKLVFSEFDYTVGKTIFSKDLISAAGIEDEDLGIIFTMYPNPATNKITLEVSGEMQLEKVTIIDLSGRLVLQTEAREETITLNIDSIIPGMYLVSIQGGNKHHVRKLLIQ
jgi:hypothetical protein